jgi:hypothetical protein
MKNTVVSTAKAPVYLEGEAEPRETLTKCLDRPNRGLNLSAHPMGVNITQT